MWYSAEETIEYCFREVVGTPQVKRLDFENLIWACGGMVDTLVLGTSANAWEFESLHAQFNRRLDLLMNKSKGLFSS